MRVWNRLPRPRHCLPAVAFAAVGLVAAASVVWAHEGREVHGFTFDVGFLVEPAYEGQPNGVYLSVTRAGGDHHGSGPASDGGHEHGGTVETTAMSVAVTAEVDPIDGINVHIVPSGFVFAPEQVNQADVEGDGHAHVYVDGEKVGRAYGEWFHLKGVAPGDREIRVTLQTNGHSEYVVDGQPVQAATTINVPAMPPAPEEVGHVEAPAGMRVAISLEPDPLGGANLKVTPQGFTLAPAKVNAQNVSGEGHPHLYVNGVRLGRIYSPFLHLGKLAPGMNEVRVTLNTNMHQEYANRGETIAAVETIHIPDGGASDGMQMDAGQQAQVGINGLANSLMVEVTHLAADMSASGVARQMALTPLRGEDGGYVAPFIPTAPGPYRFRFVGTIDGLPVDETFTSGPGTFDDVRSATEAQFPRPVPSAREIAGVATAAQQQARDASDASATAVTIAVTGLVVGGLGLLTGVGLALYAFRRRGAG